METFALLQLLYYSLLVGKCFLAIFNLEKICNLIWRRALFFPVWYSQHTLLNSCLFLLIVESSAMDVFVGPLLLSTFCLKVLGQWTATALFRVQLSTVLPHFFFYFMEGLAK